MRAKPDIRAKREKAGRRAEVYAAMFLRLKGYQILEQRYKSHHCEIDIIARKKDVLVIIEVKFRKTLTEAQDSLTDYAQRRIIQAAESYYARTPKAQSLSIRFDAVYVVGRGRIIHEIDAWRDY